MNTLKIIAIVRDMFWVSRIKEASRNKNIANIPFAFIFTVTSLKSLVINRQPTSDDIGSYVTQAIGSKPVNIKGEDLSSGCAYFFILLGSNVLITILKDYGQMQKLVVLRINER